jgi:uncharacterized protein (DUF488 family)
MIDTLYTIGGYGFANADFFSTLLEHQVDCLCDIRQRRGMRGSRYSFLNSSRLQEQLASLNIAYIHLKELAPTTTVREHQRAADAAANIRKQQRTELGRAFIEAFAHDVLGTQEPALLLAKLPMTVKRPCLFCVERTPSACHRSVVADWIHSRLGTPVVHLGGAHDRTYRFEDPHGLSPGLRRGI